MPSLPSHVGVLFGGPSPEHDVSVLTGLQAARALSRVEGVTSSRALYWSKNGAFFLVDPLLEASAFAGGPPQGAEALVLVVGPDGGFKIPRSGLRARLEQIELDAVVVCCHGGPGEDGSLQGALDLAGIAYSGPSAASAALGMDKLASYAAVASAGLPALERRLLHPEMKLDALAGPFIVKPRFGGSSIGIEVVADLATARDRLGASVHFRRGAVIEPYRADLFDLQIAVRTYPALELSAIERPLRSSAAAEILGYGDKYVGGEGMAAAPRELPAKIPAALMSELRAVAREAAMLLGARGVARIDFLSDGESIYLNEINTIPGSLSRHLFVDPTVPFEALLESLFREAIERPSVQFSSAGADGTVLRAAGSIAAKLA